jgi:uncharacterized membrane protein YhaH (DUF805 family)
MRRGGYLSLGLKDIFDPKGRIDRLTYLIYAFILGMMQFVLMFAVAAVLVSISGQIPETWKPYPHVARRITSLPVLYGVFCIQAKRLHDLGLPAIFGVLAITDILFAAGFDIARHINAVQAVVAPHLNDITEGVAWGVLIFDALLLFTPGKKGANRYGLNSTGEALPRPLILEG